MKLYYCNINNFGDILNEYIFKTCFNIEAEFASSWEADAIGIGSIMDRCLLQIRDTIPFILDKLFNFKKPLYILSSGFGHPTVHYTKKPRFYHSAVLKRKILPVSLRGYLTKNQLDLIVSSSGERGKLKPPVLGDLGLLSYKLVEDIPYEPVYKIGICPHYGEKHYPVFNKILKENAPSIMLDTLDNPIEFLTKMKQCKTVISSGLHPLIAADSLGIPNLWVRVSEGQQIHKFKDYYSVFNIDPKPCYINDTTVDEEIIKSAYKIDNKELKMKQKELFDVHKTFFTETGLN